MRLGDLVRMNRMHLRDLLSVGLLDESWSARFPEVLAERLRLIIGDPEG